MLDERACLRDDGIVKRIECFLWLVGFLVVGAGALVRVPVPPACAELDGLCLRPVAAEEDGDLRALQMHVLPAMLDVDAVRRYNVDPETTPGSGSLLSRFSPMNHHIPPPIAARSPIGGADPEDASAFGFALETDPLHAFVIDKPSLGWLADDVMGAEQPRNSEAAGTSSGGMPFPSRDRDAFGGGWPVGGL